MSASAAAGPSATIQLSHLMVQRDAALHTLADDSSPVVAHLRAGSVCVSLADVTTATGEHWCHVVHSVEGQGYLSVGQGNIRPMTSSPFFYGDRFVLVRAPRQQFPEPDRSTDPSKLDTTFTITFNGRIGAFFDAFGSVLQHLGSVGCVADWIVICDAGAKAEHREEILHAMPWVTFIGKGRGLHCHPVSLNILLALVRTRWWLQWEDDWELQQPAELLMRARDVMAESGVHQLALNGAWQARDALWGPVCEPTEHLVQRTTVQGSEYVEVLYPEDQRQRLLADDESIDALIDGYMAGMRPVVQGEAHGSAGAEAASGASTQPLLWPLYSNQPSLNDAHFLRALLPFNESADHCPPRRYWKWEFEFGVRFVRAGGRKASLVCPPGGAARPIDCSSSSYGTAPPPEVAELIRHVTPPSRVDVPLAPPAGLTELD